MARTKFHTLIGLAGVAENERPIAKKWGKRLEVPMIILAVWILIVWYMDASGKITSDTFFIVSDWIIWSFFIIETILLTTLCRDKIHYLSSNWINLLIILGGIPVLWGFTSPSGGLRMLRLLLMVSLLAGVSNTVRDVLSRNQLGKVLSISFMIIIMAGILITGIDPAIETPWDGIWWAWVTVTTVGYGDLVPTSNVGRFFGAFIILLGVVLFSLLTAAISAFFISKEEEKIKKKEDISISKLVNIERRLDQLEKKLDSYFSDKQ